MTDLVERWEAVADRPVPPVAEHPVDQPFQQLRAELGRLTREFDELKTDFNDSFGDYPELCADGQPLGPVLSYFDLEPNHSGMKALQRSQLFPLVNAGELSTSIFARLKKEGVGSSRRGAADAMLKAAAVEIVHVGEDDEPNVLETITFVNPGRSIQEFLAGRVGAYKFNTWNAPDYLIDISEFGGDDKLKMLAAIHQLYSDKLHRIEDKLGYDRQVMDLVLEAISVAEERGLVVSRKTLAQQAREKQEAALERREPAMPERAVEGSGSKHDSPLRGWGARRRP